MSDPRWTCSTCGTAATQAFLRVGDWTWRCYCEAHGYGDSPDFPIYYMRLSATATNAEIQRAMNEAMENRYSYLGSPAFSNDEQELLLIIRDLQDDGDGRNRPL